MTVVATGVADFSTTGAETGFGVVELDETLNVDSLGEVITSFSSTDAVWFWVHHDASSIIDHVACTDPHAMITDHGIVRRSRSAELLFTGQDDVSLSYAAAGPLQWAWRGAVGDGVVVDGRVVRVSGNLPCACEVVIPIDVRLFCLQPGHTDAQIVVYLQEVGA